jgi:hypothetical protein
VPKHFPLALGERLDGRHGGPFRRTRRGGGLVLAQDRCEQAPVGAGQFRVTPQQRPDPATLHDERQPELLTFGQPKRRRQ